MTNNRDRAAEILHRHHDNCNDAADALDAAGVLAPDLPTPDRDGKWWPTASRLGNVNIRDRRVYIHSGVLDPRGISFTPDDADDLAGILKAAAAAARTHQEKK